MLAQLSSFVGSGTKRYPEKVARRLRTVNITAWIAASGIVLFVLKSPTDIDPLTVAAAAMMASVPLLHRFGSTVAATVLVVIGFARVTRLACLIGTGDGIWLAYLTLAPLSILLFGVEHASIAGILTVVGVVSAAALRATMPVDTGYLPPTALTINFCVNFAINAALLFFVVYCVSRNAVRTEAAAEREFARSEVLLASILPPEIASRPKQQEVIADHHESASVLFADMAGFTERAGDTSPQDLVGFLNRVYLRLDGLVEASGLEKIKTTGDSYMVVAGVPRSRTMPRHWQIWRWRYAKRWPA